MQASSLHATRLAARADSRRRRGSLGIRFAGLERPPIEPEGGKGCGLNWVISAPVDVSNAASPRYPAPAMLVKLPPRITLSPNGRMRVTALSAPPARCQAVASPFPGRNAAANCRLCPPIWVKLPPT